MRPSASFHSKAAYFCVLARRPSSQLLPQSRRKKLCRYICPYPPICWVRTPHCFWSKSAPSTSAGSKAILAAWAKRKCVTSIAHSNSASDWYHRQLCGRNTAESTYNKDAAALKNQYEKCCILSWFGYNVNKSSCSFGAFVRSARLKKTEEIVRGSSDAPV